MIIVTTLLLLLMCVLLHRNNRVADYRRAMLRVIEQANEANPFDVDWRIKAYESVEYTEMWLKFWKPLDSFYPDKSFLDLTVVRGRAPREKAS